VALWREDRPLDRIRGTDERRGETRRANAALREYALMGPGRSLLKLHARFRAIPKKNAPQPPTRRLSTLKLWSTKYDWVARVNRWGKIRWETRRRAILESDWEDGRALREKALKLLEGIDGSSLSQVVEAIQVASKLQRMATDEPTDKVEVALTGQALDGVIEREIARLLEEMGDGLGVEVSLEDVLPGGNNRDISKLSTG